MGGLSCSGRETSLFSCNRNEFIIASGTCTHHYYDVGLKCERMFLSLSLSLSHSLSLSVCFFLKMFITTYLYIALCINGTARLRQGPTLLSGRVEVCLNESWGTICSNFWDDNDASVICKQLGNSPYGNT